MTYNDKTVVYTQEIYNYSHTNKEFNPEKSVKNNDKLLTGNTWMDRITLTTSPVDRWNSGSSIGPGHYLDYESMIELDDWNRGGSSSGGGGTGSAVVISPAPEDKIIIDKTFEDNKCVKDIYDKLGGTEIGKRFIDPFKLNTGISLSYKIEYYNRESHGYTISVPKKSHQYQIAINGNYLQRSKVDIAKTIIHETIHANILAYLHSKSIGFATDNPEFSEIWDTYTDLTLQEKALIKKEGNDSFHHEYMAEKYIEVLVMGMKQYLGNSNNFTDAELGAFAWGGLMGTKIYKSLPSREKSSILTNYERAKTKGERNSCY
ncbi:hypothetical protein AV926_06360 [Myroides marinus]|uniref:SprT-like family protein n=1 Tax=Myroides marinus TaxID=703342 RepID=A0A161SL13_9FLAO|nr:hypothetical protein [Myroides marinus]KZE82855.1 hypothetical protein AV926_06360 [Myroides marinus]